MNQTPRGLNRVVLALLGLVLMLLGALAVALAAFAPAAGWWQQAMAGTGAWLRGLLQTSTLPGQQDSWLWPAAALGLVVLIVLLVAWAAQQGRGRLSTLVVDYDGGGVPGVVSLSSGTRLADIAML